MLTQTPPQISSPGPVQSPPVVIKVVPVSLPLVWPVDDDSLPEVDVVPELDVDVSGSVVADVSEVEEDVVDVIDVADVSELVGATVDDPVISGLVVVGGLFVLDIESVPAEVPLIDPLVVAVVVSVPAVSPLQAARLRPTSAAIMTGAAPTVGRSAAAQNGQRLSRSNR